MRRRPRPRPSRRARRRGGATGRGRATSGRAAAPRGQHCAGRRHRGDRHRLPQRVRISLSQVAVLWEKQSVCNVTQRRCGPPVGGDQTLHFGARPHVLAGRAARACVRRWRSRRSPGEKRESSPTQNRDPISSSKPQRSAKLRARIPHAAAAPCRPIGGVERVQIVLPTIPPTVHAMEVQVPFPLAKYNAAVRARTSDLPTAAWLPLAEERLATRRPRCSPLWFSQSQCQ